jgi:hypothetical protein
MGSEIYGSGPNGQVQMDWSEENAIGAVEGLSAVAILVFTVLIIDALIVPAVTGGTILAAQGGGAPSCWPGPENGRQIINGLEYTIHALERMMPSGLTADLFSRGIPPSVVENVLEFGTSELGNTPGTLVWTLENIQIVTDDTGTLIITVIGGG